MVKLPLLGQIDKITWFVGGVIIGGVMLLTLLFLTVFGAELIFGISTYRVVPGRSGITIYPEKPEPIQLPNTAPIETGLVIDSRDDTIYVGTGNIQVKEDADGLEFPFYDGPEIEVTLTSNTKIFKDLSIGAVEKNRLLEGEGKNTGGNTNRVLKQVYSIEEIDLLSYIEVWGYRRGNRIIATILVYQAYEPHLGG